MMIGQMGRYLDRTRADDPLLGVSGDQVYGLRGIPSSENENSASVQFHTSSDCRDGDRLHGGDWTLEGVSELIVGVGIWDRDLGE
jgi:hypothetical protein